MGAGGDGFKGLNIVSWNVNVLTAEKATYLSDLASRLAADRRLDILMLCEVGRDVPVDIPGFVLYRGVVRQNRSAYGAGKGQGMAVYVRSTLSTYCKKVKATDYYMWLRIALPQRSVMHLACVYIPPEASAVEWQGDDSW